MEKGIHSYMKGPETFLLIFGGFTMKRTSKCRDRFLGCKSSPGPGKLTFQPKKVVEYKQNQPHQV